MIPRDIAIFIHIEGDDIGKGQEALLMIGNQTLISGERSGTCRETKDKGTGCSGIEGINAILHILSNPLTHSCRVGTYDHTHTNKGKGKGKGERRGKRVRERGRGRDKKRDKERERERVIYYKRMCEREGSMCSCVYESNMNLSHALD